MIEPAIPAVATNASVGRRRRLAAFVLSGIALAACGSGTSSTAAPSTETVTESSGESVSAGDATFVERLDAIQGAVTAWAEATSIGDATAAAEAAANLVVGPNGPGYGDRNGDGELSGASDVGLLSGIDGVPEGIAVGLAGNTCVTRDVLGATSTDVAAGWAEMEAAIAAWAPDRNTMPSLASHPMRVVGWATFTIASESLEQAHEYASHAQLHVDVSLDALDC